MASVPPISYAIELDVNRDNFATLSPIRDITDYVIGVLQAQAGMWSSPEESVSNPARLTFTASNHGGEFNREGYIGGERLVNGDFSSWTGLTPNGWTIVNGASVAFGQTDAEFTGSGTGAAGFDGNMFAVTTTSMSQDVFIPGKVYRVVIEYWRHPAFTGSLTVTAGSKTLGEMTITQRYDYTFVADGAPLTIAAQRVGVYHNTIDSISVKELPTYQICQIGMLCRLRATRAGITNTLFLGRITAMQPTPGDNQLPTMAFTAEDVMLDLLDKEYAPPLLTDSPTADEAIARIFDDPSGSFAWPYARNFWMLGVPGSSELGLTTNLYENTLTNDSGGNTTLETGIQEFSYLGDAADRGQGINTQQYIRDLVSSEAGGRFYFDPREGVFRFHNRHHDTLNDASNVQATLTAADIDAANLSYGDDTRNNITVNFTHRTIGAANSTIWSAQNLPLLIKGNTSKPITARYFDATDTTLKISATDPISPVAGLDYVANASSSGGGETLTNNISMGVEFGATSAKLIVSNSGVQDAYITTLQLRGTPLTSVEQSIDHQDTDSIRANELKPNQPIELRLLDDPDMALNAAQWFVAQYRTPVQRVRSVTINSLNNANTQAFVFERELFDRVTVRIPSASHDADYFIASITMNIAIGGDMPAIVTYGLKPASRTNFWLLGTVGRSELGSTTILGF